eukprot:gene11024-7846_t
MQVLFIFIVLALTVIANATTQPLADCPLSNVDVFLIASPASYPLLGFLMNSIARFMPCSRRVNLLVDRGDAYRRAKLWLAPSYGSHTVRLYPFDFPDSVPEISHHEQRWQAGYILQAWVMLWADRYSLDNRAPQRRFFHFATDARQAAESHDGAVDYVLFLDTDSLLAMPLTCAALFDALSRPLFPAWSIAKQKQFQVPCVNMTGGACDRSYMAFFPFVFPLRAFPLLRSHVWQRLDPAAASFDAAFNTWSQRENWRHFSQFVVMGEFLRLRHPQLARQIFCDGAAPTAASALLAGRPAPEPARTDRDLLYPPASLGGAWALSLSETQLCALYVPPAVHYGWPYQHYLSSHAVARAEFKPSHFRAPPAEQRHPVDRRFTGKFGLNTVRTLSGLVHHGECLSAAWRLEDGGANDTEVARLLQPLGCGADTRGGLHPALDLHFRRRSLPRDALKATFQFSFALAQPPEHERFDFADALGHARRPPTGAASSSPIAAHRAVAAALRLVAAGAAAAAPRRRRAAPVAAPVAPLDAAAAAAASSSSVTLAAPKAPPHQPQRVARSTTTATATTRGRRAHSHQRNGNGNGSGRRRRRLSTDDREKLLCSRLNRRLPVAP